MPRTCPELILTENERGETIEKPCDRHLLKGSDRCVFHDPNAWRTHTELIRKEIKEKIEKGDLNFQKCHLPEVDFSAITKAFKELIDFRRAVFHGDVCFNHLRFLKSAYFGHAEFSGMAWFGGAKFYGTASFDGAEFSQVASFTGVEFSEDAMFVDAKFYAEVGFGGAKFHGEAAFSKAMFSKQAWFYQAEFSGVTSFADAKFSNKAQFDFSQFRGIVLFNWLSMNDIHFTFLHTLFERGMSVDEDSWSRSGYRLLIEGSDLALAADSYRALRQGFEHMGRYTVAGELFYREMTCKKNMTRFSETIAHSGSIGFPKQFGSLIQTLMKNKPLGLALNKVKLLLEVRVRWNKLFDWLWIRLFDISCGFGERPRRVVLGCILTVLAFAGLYFPIAGTSTDIWQHLKSAFLLSIDAFTPGRFLNIPFASPGEWLVQAENVLGWFMLALFLLVFTRKMSRG